MEIREAALKDWSILVNFYAKIYRKNHPLRYKEFWEWQYGDTRHGRSFVCIDKDSIIGHVGANFGGGIAWIINVYLDPGYRGKGILRKLYALARNYYPLAATAANQAGLGLYRNMGWIRYYDLVRYVKINPNYKKPSFSSIVRDTTLTKHVISVKGSHYFKQPGLKSVQFKDYSTGVSQTSVGGLRLVHLENLESTEEQLWNYGFLWADYITSWNDKKINSLERVGWIRDTESIVPWRLNPVQTNYFCDISFLSEKPLPNDFIVKRSYSDHGRVGSIIEL